VVAASTRPLRIATGSGRDDLSLGCAGRDLSGVAADGSGCDDPDAPSSAGVGGFAVRGEGYAAHGESCGRGFPETMGVRPYLPEWCSTPERQDVGAEAGDGTAREEDHTDQVGFRMVLGARIPPAREEVVVVEDGKVAAAHKDHQEEGRDNAGGPEEGRDSRQRAEDLEVGREVSGEDLEVDVGGMRQVGLGRGPNRMLRDVGPVVEDDSRHRRLLRTADAIRTEEVAGGQGRVGMT
jgi:hypothetical protein